MSDSLLGPAPFRSFWMGGYEGADHINGAGERHDMVRATGHDQRLDRDYRRARLLGIRTVRESVGWRLTESVDGRFDFGRAQRMAEAAQRQGIQILWTLMHYGMPPGLTLLDDAFIPRFARFAAEAARVLGPLSDGPRFYTPVNEISFLAWAASASDAMGPTGMQTGHHEASSALSGYAIKKRLVRAALAGIAAIREVDPAARFLHVEPVVHIAPATDDPGHAALAEQISGYQWQAFDMLAGRAEPELGGHPEALDWLGMNHYHSSQWEVPTERRLTWHLRDLRREPLSALLQRVWQRYERPLIVAETGHIGVGRGTWLHEIAGEAVRAREMGVPLHGVCLYPMLDRPDWYDTRQWHRSGLWHLPVPARVDAGTGAPLVGSHAASAENDRSVSVRAGSAAGAGAGASKRAQALAAVAMAAGDGDDGDLFHDEAMEAAGATPATESLGPDDTADQACPAPLVRRLNKPYARALLDWGHLNALAAGGGAGTGSINVTAGGSAESSEPAAPGLQVLLPCHWDGMTAAQQQVLLHLREDFLVRLVEPPRSSSVGTVLRRHTLAPGAELWVLHEPGPGGWTQPPSEAALQALRAERSQLGERRWLLWMCDWADARASRPWWTGLGADALVYQPADEEPSPRRRSAHRDAGDPRELARLVLASEWPALPDRMPLPVPDSWEQEEMQRLIGGIPSPRVWLYGATPPADQAQAHARHLMTLTRRRPDVHWVVTAPAPPDWDAAEGGAANLHWIGEVHPGLMAALAGSVDEMTPQPSLFAWRGAPSEVEELAPVVRARWLREAFLGALGG